MDPKIIPVTPSYLEHWLNTIMGQFRGIAPYAQYWFVNMVRTTERHPVQVIRAAWLWCRKSQEGHEFKAADWKTVNPANGYLLQIREG